MAQLNLHRRAGVYEAPGSARGGGFVSLQPPAFVLCLFALVADPRPDVLRNAATCTASGAATYNSAAATYTTDVLGLSAAAAQHRRRPLKPTGCFWLLMLFLLSGDIESNPGLELHIFSQNVCSLKNKLGTLRTHAGELTGYDAIRLTETWLGPHVPAPLRLV